MDGDGLTPEMLERIACDCTAVRVRLINRVVSAIYDEALRPHGLRVSQANLLVVIARLREARPVEVCRLLRIDKTTFSRDAETMKGKGWIVSDPPAGGRNQILSLTASGRRLLAEAAPSWARAQAEAERRIGDAGVVAIRDIASRLGLGGDG